jgi:hypothetical protein
MKHTDTRVLTVEVRSEKTRPRWCDDNSIQLYYVNEKAADGVARMQSTRFIFASSFRTWLIH